MFMLLAAEGYNLFGELRAQPSRLAPDCSMDPVVGHLVASGLASAATLLCASLLRTAFKCVTSVVIVFLDHEYYAELVDQALLSMSGSPGQALYST